MVTRKTELGDSREERRAVKGRAQEDTRDTDANSRGSSSYAVQSPGVLSDPVLSPTEGGVSICPVSPLWMQEML